MLLKGRKNRRQFVTLIILNPRNHLYLQKVCDFIQNYKIKCVILSAIYEHYGTTENKTTLQHRGQRRRPIVGESGVGKEIIPRIIHDNSPRRREKYFAINCGSIPEGTIDSELFGHEKGSFTGAVGESEGYFGIANRGTIFLDEVGELPQATQARLLRVLETGEYIRVGGTEIRKTDVRIVAATNVNMQKALREGRFREDLYYRLSTIPIQMPPLRNRGADIILLFRLFAMQMAEKYHLPKITLSEEAKERMMRYKWPGNVRQLKNITEQMSVLSPQREITPELLAQYIPEDQESTQLAVIPSQTTPTKASANCSTRYSTNCAETFLTCGASSTTCANRCRRCAT